MLTKIHGGSNNNLLRISGLMLGESGMSTALLVRSIFKTTVNGSPMLTMVFRTADKKTIIGNMFDLVQGDDLAQTLLHMYRTTVDIAYTVQEWNGRYTLLVKGVVVNNTADVSEFFDSYAYLDDMYNSVVGSMRTYLNNPSYSFSSTIKSQSSFDVGRGKVGGTLLVISRVLNTLSVYVEYEDFSDCISAFASVIPAYLEYCKMLTKIPIIPKNELLELIVENVKYISDYRVKSISSDVISSLVGLGNPEHFWSHVICDSFNAVVKHINYEADLESAISGSVVRIGDSILTKY
jgi:hypothetical protein